jgi:UPF0042 nucleotide-binding protein
VRLIVITGLSGAGKSTARGALEELGYHAVDNLPPSLWAGLVETLRAGGQERIAVVVDSRANTFLGDLPRALEGLRRQGITPEVLFVQARDDVLIQRYGASRRAHPLGDASLAADVGRERVLLGDLRAVADHLIDTSELTERELRGRIIETFGGERQFRLRLVSFGFKYGLPADSDTVIDARSLPNPYYDPRLGASSGLDPEVLQYVLGGAGQDFYRSVLNLVATSASLAGGEDRAALTVSVGCTGGRHRSVAIVEQLARDLAPGYRVVVQHRDIDKEEWRP